MPDIATRTRIPRKYVLEVDSMKSRFWRGTLVLVLCTVLYNDGYKNDMCDEKIEKNANCGRIVLTVIKGKGASWNGKRSVVYLQRVG